MDSGADHIVDQLPAAYASALQLREAGYSHDEIAARVGVEDEEVPALLLLAEAKLVAARRNR